MGLNHWHFGFTLAFFIVSMMMEHSPLPKAVQNAVVSSDQ
jgi:hypothetical protein